MPACRHDVLAAIGTDITLVDVGSTEKFTGATPAPPTQHADTPGAAAAPRTRPGRSNVPRSKAPCSASTLHAAEIRLNDIAAHWVSSPSQRRSSIHGRLIASAASG